MNDDLRASYARAGMGGPVPRGERPAIIVVDLMTGFTDPEHEIGMDLTTAVVATSELVTTARPADVPVVFITESFTLAEIESDAIAWLRKLPNLAMLTVGSKATELDPRLPVLATDHIINKKGPSAFFGTGLAALLSTLRVDTVLVCGATTSGCIRATVIDAVQSGFNVLVPADAVGDRAEGPHRSNLFDMNAKYADVIDQVTALEYVRSLRRSS
jgi:maleamate amidohydrolase